MDFVEIIFLSFALALDAVAVSIASGTRSDVDNKKARFRLSFHFGLFQFIMPILGWYSGFHLAEVFSNFDHWIAFFILSYVGYKMLKEAFISDQIDFANNPSKGRKLILLSIATSIDALAVGFSLALLKINIFLPALTIGLITGLLSLIGIYIGKYFGTKFSKVARIAGGVILFAIGVKILLEHTLFHSEVVMKNNQQALLSFYLQ